MSRRDQRSELLAKDENLLSKLKENDNAAWSLLRRWLYRMASRDIKPSDREGIADLVQDVALAIMEGAKSFEGRSLCSTWIIGIYRNKRSSRFGGKKNKGTTVHVLSLAEIEDDIPAGPQDRSMDPTRQLAIAVQSVEELIAEEKRDSTRRLALEVVRQALLAPKAPANTPYSELAQRWNCSLDAVGVRLNKARHAVKTRAEAKIRELQTQDTPGPE